MIRLAKLINRPHLPRRTVRLRLTLLYGGLFLVSGTALLGITYLLLRHSTGDIVMVRADTPPAVSSERGGLRIDPDGRVLTVPNADFDVEDLRLITPEQAARGTIDVDRLPALIESLPNELRQLAENRREQAAAQRAEQLRQFLIQSGFALGLMAIVSIGLGWLMAGRVLRPLRTMTQATKRISEHNLHQRLALAGPRDELTELGETIDGLLERLEAAFEAQRRFVANASHELRTPLAMMRTSLDVAKAKPEPVAPEVEKLDLKLREGLDRADRLLEDFLTLARTENGGLIEREEVSIQGVVETTIDERGDELAARGLELRGSREVGRAAAVAGSRTLLSHLAENLIENAIRHNEPGGWISVETRTAGDSVCLTVENPGERIDPADVAELTQPFRRLGDERTGSEEGVGLGLSIVAAIAEAHDGRLELTARNGGGLRVLVELPRAEGAR